MDTYHTIAEEFGTTVANSAQSTACCASTSERLEYLAAMVVGLRRVAGAVPESSLPAILDSARAEVGIQLIRCTK